MSSEITGPTFIGIGAQKCASTWIYEILRDHPEVVVSDVKEIDFFSYRYDHGLQWYLKHFRPTPGARAVGEISPSYFHEPAVPERVKRHYPQARIVVSLRDPVARAISNHKHEVRIGHLEGDDLSFETGLRNNPTYIDQGLYGQHLGRWLELFPRDQVLVLLFEEIARDRAQTAQRVFRFLEIDDAHTPAALDETPNPSHAIRHQKLEALRIQLHALADKAGLSWVLRAASRIGSRKLYSMINRVPSESVIPPISDATRSSLRQRFIDDIAALEKLLERDLSDWRC